MSPLPVDPPIAGPARHILSMTVLMTPELGDPSGDVRGGEVLKLLDQVASTCATRWTQQQVVTLSVDQVVFRQPIRVGDLVTFDAAVNFTGNTSMEVGVRVTTENIREGTVRHTNSCYFTVVALDSDHKPTSARPVHPRTQEEWRRFERAAARREERRRAGTAATIGGSQPSPGSST